MLAVTHSMIDVSKHLILKFQWNCVSLFTVAAAEDGGTLLLLSVWRAGVFMYWKKTPDYYHLLLFFHRLQVLSHTPGPPAAIFPPVMHLRTL